MNKINRAYRDIVARFFDEDVESRAADVQEYADYWPADAPGVVATRKSLTSAIERRDAVLAWLDNLIEKGERDESIHQLHA